MASATFLGTAEEFGRMVRRFDLSVVRQAEPRTGTSDHLIVQAAIFDSGRPVIVVPYGHTMPARFDRILVCWDGSRSAARAAADAFPFLRRAKAIEVLTVGRMWPISLPTLSSWEDTAIPGCESSS